MLVQLSLSPLPLGSRMECTLSSLYVPSDGAWPVIRNESICGDVSSFPA